MSAATSAISIFLDLRDHTGRAQIVCNPAISAEVHDRAEEIRGEYVMGVEGEVVLRAPGTVNSTLATGEVEVMARTLLVLNEAKTPPFPIEDETKTSEETRLRYRYLDLRRGRMQRNLRLRHRSGQVVRAHMGEHGFQEIETPFMTRSTPEGARDYLVPSRLHHGHFYALPQSPQLFKQLLMIGGFDRYYQIVRCFRDEDLRADRQPEFTQIDIEMAFPQREVLFDIIEAPDGKALCAGRRQGAAAVSPAWPTTRPWRSMVPTSRTRDSAWNGNASSLRRATRRRCAWPSPSRPCGCRDGATALAQPARQASGNGEITGRGLVLLHQVERGANRNRRLMKAAGRTCRGGARCLGGGAIRRLGSAAGAQVGLQPRRASHAG